MLITPKRPCKTSFKFRRDAPSEPEEIPEQSHRRPVRGPREGLGVRLVDPPMIHGVPVEVLVFRGGTNQWLSFLRFPVEGIVADKRGECQDLHQRFLGTPNDNVLAFKMIVP